MKGNLVQASTSKGNVEEAYTSKEINGAKEMRRKIAVKKTVYAHESSSSFRDKTNKENVKQMEYSLSESR